MRCSQWTRTVRGGLALQCECSSGRVGRVVKGVMHRLRRKGGICHERSTCNWVTTGREADAVCTRRSGRVQPGVHTNDFAPIHRLRALKLGHASLATVFRPGRLTLQPILRENLESPVLRYQPITTAVVTDACLNTRWHHGAYTSAVLRESLGLDRVVTVYAELSRPDWLATVQSGRKQVQSRVCTPSLPFAAGQSFVV